MKRVQVLLSAYNGEKYIAQQIESILRQKYVDIFLLVRDDGSLDKTWKILAGYAALYPNIRVYAGENIGTQKSYFDLLAHADAGMDYYAFSDQDDVWHPQKMQRAAAILSRETENQPLLYAGSVICAMEDLRTKKRLLRPARMHPSFGNALVENICIGCTEVFNQELLELVRMHPPRCGIFHDWWLYMSASCFGKVCYDHKAYILYRQHGQNQVGMQDTLWKKWKHRMRKAEKLRGLLSGQARDFAYVYKDMLRENKEPESKELELVAGYRQDRRKKREILADKTVCRQNAMDQWVFKILFGIGYL